jgi:thioredoxin reductase
MTLPTHAQVVIVGSGPAGLSAALALRRQGIGVLILEREPTPGGVPRFCGHYPFGWREFRRVLRGPDYARKLVAAARAAGAQIATRVTVTALHDGPRLSLSTPDGLTEITGDAVLLATGVRETPRAGRAIAGGKPAGVMTVGTLQTMVYGSHLRPFRAPVILGSELVAFSALTTCAHAGIRPVAMVEPGAQATARWPASVYPRLRGVPFMTDTDVIAIEGRDRVTGVTLRRGGKVWTVAADGLVTSGQFRPDAVLLRDSPLASDEHTGGPLVDSFGRCSAPGYFAAGNLLRPAESAGWCWQEGQLIAAAIARGLRGTLPDAPECVNIDSDALAWVMPQRPDARGPLPGLQVGLRRAVRGQIIATGGDGRQVAFAVNARPERRIMLPVVKLPAGPVTLHVKVAP